MRPIREACRLPNVGLEWSSLRRSKDVVQEPALLPSSPVYVPLGQVRAHCFVEDMLQNTNDADKDAIGSQRFTTRSVQSNDSRSIIPPTLRR